MEKDKIKVKSIILLLKNLYDCLKFKDDKRKKTIDSIETHIHTEGVEI